MAINAFKEVTPSAKMALINNALGNPALKKNQGSTFEIYDYVEITAPGTAETVNFFGNVNTKTFPLTNIQQNQLGVGESLAVQYIAFTRLQVLDAGNVVKSVTPLIQVVSGITLGNFSLLLDNSRIIKVNSLLRSDSTFNPKGKTSSNYLFYPDTDLTIPPQISFTLDLRVPANTDTAVVGAKIYYGVHLFGTGAILNLKTNV
jgi:hypothetical protein